MTKNVLGLLALAVSSSVALAQGGGWSAKAGDGLKYDGGDAFGMSVNGHLKVSLTDMSEANTTSFGVDRARIGFSGHAFNKNIQYKLMLDANDNGTNSVVKEAWMQWNFANSDSGTIGMRFGQSKIGHGLEATGTSTGLYHTGRSLASDTFGEGRVRGLWFNGKHADSKLRWTAGVNNGASSGEEGANNDTDLGMVASVNFDPLGDFFGGAQTVESFRQGDMREGDRGLVGTVGLGYASDRMDATDTERESTNINTAWSFSGFQVLAEMFDATDSVGAVDTDTDGYAFGANYTLCKQGDSSLQWGFGVRQSTFTDVQDDLSFVVNAFYHGHACKTQLGVTQSDFDAGGDETTITLAFQLLF